MDTTIQKQLQRLARQEEKLLKKSEGPMASLSSLVEEKIPDGLQEKLQQAFYLGFKTIFEKGGGLIEKTYDREELTIQHQVYDVSFDRLDAKKSLKDLNKMANSGRLRNLGITALEGTGLGALGIGLPDIPIFIGIVLKSVYEIALSYGFDPRLQDEQYYILKLLEASLAPEETRKKTNTEVDRLASFLIAGIPVQYDWDQQLHRTADVFATDMLCLKFIQGLPLVGIVGGPANVFYCKRVTDYAGVKYQKRYLLQKQYHQQVPRGQNRAPIADSQR